MKIRTAFSTALTAALLSAAIANPTSAGAQEALTPKLFKDPLLSSYLSATVPGLGQAYVGHKGRGFLFFAGTVGSFLTAAALFQPADLELSDYDHPDFGGNGDGLLSISEVKNWEDKEYQDDAFDRLSGGRKAGIITGALVGAGLYIWNIFDARNLARAHNRELRQRKIDLGVHLGPDASPRLAMQYHF